MRALYVCLLQLVVASLLSAAEIEVETGRGSPIHVLVPGEENRLGLRIVNDGKKEEQFTLKYVVEKIAEIKNLPPETVAEISEKNAKSLFFK